MKSSEYTKFKFLDLKFKRNLCMLLCIFQINQLRNRTWEEVIPGNENNIIGGKKRVHKSIIFLIF